ncbi:hypothetical protein [Aliarcobacter butzleri]|uniref:hypothetical protein n=1 Tax=Aliarcobacter butzleri TaxID=28197 RepID=UPI00125F43F7|nr:hypothetical protein [Aliarcobacter butzleri]
MFNPLTLLTSLKGSLNTILVLVGFFVVGTIGYKLYSMSQDINLKNQEISKYKKDLQDKDQLLISTKKEYEIKIVEAEQKATQEQLKKEIDTSLAQAKQTLTKEIEIKKKEVKNDQDTCNKCYSDFLF